MTDNLIELLRAEAADALECANDEQTPEDARAPFAYMHELLTNAANRIEADATRFAEHQAAWKANNAHFAKRIEELEKALLVEEEDLYDAVTGYRRDRPA